MPEVGPLRPERVAVYTLTLPGLAVAERIQKVLPGSTLYALGKYRGLLEEAVYFDEPLKELPSRPGLSTTATSSSWPRGSSSGPSPPSFWASG